MRLIYQEEALSCGIHRYIVCNGTTTFTLNKGGSDIPSAGGGLDAQDDAVVRLSGNVCFTENEASYQEACILIAVHSWCSNHP